MTAPANSWRRLVAATTLLAAAAPAAAQAPADRFWAAIEYFRPAIDSELRVDASATARQGTTIRLEDQLDLADRKGTAYLHVGLRLGERWRIELEYYALEREAVKTVQHDIDFGDVTFPIGAEVSSRFDSTIYRMTGGWSFVRDDRTEAGVGFGLHVTDFRMQASGQGTRDTGGSDFQLERVGQLVPLPTLGVYGSHALTSRWLLRGRADVMSLDGGRYDGRLLNGVVALDWRFARHLGAGVGWRFVDYRLRGRDDDFTGSVRYMFKGPTVYVSAGF